MPVYNNFLFRSTRDRDTKYIYDYLEGLGYNTNNILDNDYSKWNYHILIRTDSKTCIAGTKHSEQDVIDVVTKDYPNTYMRFYDMKSLEHFKTLVDHSNRPTYKPRKILRESLMLPKFPQRFLSDTPWDVIIFRFNTREGLERTKKFIEQFDIFIYYTALTGIYPSDIYMILKSTMNLRKNNLYEVNPGYYDSGDFQKNFPQTVICPILLHMDDSTEEADNFFNTHIFKAFPNYKPKHIDRTLNLDESLNFNKVLYAFDLDETLVYGIRFEEYIKPLLVREFLTPEIILKNKIDDIGIKINDLNYEHGRVFFKDPLHKINISNNSTWVRSGDRVYITQPDAYFLTKESMPIGVHEKIVDIYNRSENKAIITSRRERLRNQTELALSNLGIEKPNCGLFMYPSDSLVFQAKWKALKLEELHDGGFTEIHFFDDNIKVLKRIKSYLKKKDANITLYKVNKNNYRKI